jgi:LacI family transcriptional regulator
MYMPADEPRAARATIHDVARAAGVSIGTVSRVINGNGRTGAETRKRVNAAIEQLGYRVNTVAQSMRRQTTRAVAVLVHDISNPIFATVTSAAQSVLEGAGYVLVLASSGTAGGSEAATVSLLGQRRMDGIIGFFRREDDPETIAALREFDGALVLFDRTMDVEADVVLTDHAGGVMRATRYLLDLGHRRIALVGGIAGVYPARERTRGFIQGFEAHGIEPPPPSYIRTQSIESEYGFREASNLLFATPRPTAIIAGSNQTLEGVINAVRAASLKVPRDLSLVGFDDSAVARVFSPPITVIARNIVQMGVMAAEMVLERLSHGSDYPAQKVILNAQIVLRESCGPPPAP